MIWIVVAVFSAFFIGMVGTLYTVAKVAQIDEQLMNRSSEH